MGPQAKAGGVMEQIYQGFYARFNTDDKAQGSMLMGPDHLVGDDYEVYFTVEDDRTVARLRNKFGAESGRFDVDASRKLQLANAREQTIRAVLSFVAYSDEPEPGMYWGQMALFCFSPRHAAEMNAFVDRVAEKIAEGTRPAIDLGSQAVSKLLEDPGWFPTDTVPLPRKEKGTAVLKDHRTMSEKMIEQGRRGNAGCYAVSIAFIAIVVAAIAWFVFGLVSG